MRASLIWGSVMVETDELHDHQARCVPHVALLHMLAGRVAEAQLPDDAADQVARATSAILAEAKAAARAALAAVNDSRSRSATVSLLSTRQARLEHAADDAVASAREAARGGNRAALRERLQRFEVLTSAMWTVQMSVWEQATTGGDSPAASWRAGMLGRTAGARRSGVSPGRVPRAGAVRWDSCGRRGCRYMPFHDHENFLHL